MSVIRLEHQRRVRCKTKSVCHRSTFAASFASLVPVVTAACSFTLKSFQACAQASAQLDVRAGLWSRSAFAEAKKRRNAMQTCSPTIISLNPKPFGPTLGQSQRANTRAQRDSQLWKNNFPSPLARKVGFSWSCVGILLGFCSDWIGVLLGLDWGFVGIGLGFRWGFVGMLLERCSHRKTPAKFCYDRQQIPASFRALLGS